MLGLIPIIGPIISSVVSGAVSAWNKSQDTTLKKQIDSNKTDLEIMRVRAEVSIAQENIGNRIIRDIFMFSTAVWFGGIVWDKTFTKVCQAYQTSCTIGVDPLPDVIAYIPYAVIAYLFVTAWRGPK